MKKIKLTQGKFALVNDEDFEYLNKWKWSFAKGYAIRTSWDKKAKKYYGIRMHRLILNAPKNKQVDHKNHNGLDNRRINIRLCTQKQNHYNKRSINGSTSKYLGVRKLMTGLYMAQITYKGKNLHLGKFIKEQEAAHAYNIKATEFFGDFANLNRINKNLKKLGRIKISKSSKYIGVSYMPKIKKWVAKGCIDRKTIHLGVYLTQSEAAYEYNKWAKKNIKSPKLNKISCYFKIRGRIIPKKYSKYKGVSFVKSQNIFRVRIKLKTKDIYVGKFKNESDAALAYNKKAQELFGDNAKLNIL